jgi:hypothetical protein
MRLGIVLVCIVGGTVANMMNVIEHTKVAPAECKYGCASWDGTDLLWLGGKVPADAANHCAQPGAAVNSHKSGAWCYCSNKTAVTAGDSSISNKAFTYEKVGSGSSDPTAGEWLSFNAQNAVLYAKSAPEGSKGVWEMIPIDDDPNVMTFYIQNLWNCPTERRCGQWLSFSGTDIELYPRSSTTDKVPWKLVLVTGTTDTYHLQNLWEGVHEKRYGMWAGLASETGTENQKLILVPRNSTTTRATFKLHETKAPPLPLTFLYCTSGSGVPEQVIQRL